MKELLMQLRAVEDEISSLQLEYEMKLEQGIRDEEIEKRWDKAEEQVKEINKKLAKKINK